MSKLLKLLKNALVEPENGSDAPTTRDTNALISDLTSSGSIPAVPAPAPAPVFTPEDDLTLPEGVPLESIYAQANVPAAPYTIERLDKLVEGLNQLDAATKRTAVAAMDASDDSWKIEDVIGDARTKVAALVAYQGDITELERAIVAEVDKRITENSTKKASSLDDIDKRIAALSAEREAAIAQFSADASNLRSTAAVASEAAERERNRINTPITRFGTLIALFDAPASSTPSTP